MKDSQWETKFQHVFQGPNLEKARFLVTAGNVCVVNKNKIKSNASFAKARLL